MDKIYKKKFIDKSITFVGIIILYCFVTIFDKNISSLIKGLLVQFCVYSIMAVSLNLVVGISGELSLGHAGFMCLGAFISATFTTYMKSVFGIQNIYIFIIAILIGGIVTAFFGFLIGIPVLRLKGDYLAIVTLAFGEIIKNVLNAIYLGVDKKGLHISLKNAMSLLLDDDGVVIIKGPQGITNIPHYSNFLIAVVLLIITVFVIYNIIDQRTGRAIMALRDNRIAGESIGLNVTKYKLIAFTISSAFAGIAGVLYAHNYNNIAATGAKFGYNMSIMILVFVVLGGMGNIRGSIISAVVLTLLPEALRSLQDFRMLMYAIVLIAVMIFTNAPFAINFRKNLKFVKGNRKDEQ